MCFSQHNISSTGTITIRMSNLRTPTQFRLARRPCYCSDGQGTVQISINSSVTRHKPSDENENLVHVTVTGLYDEYGADVHNHLNIVILHVLGSNLTKIAVVTAIQQVTNFLFRQAMSQSIGVTNDPKLDSTPLTATETPNQRKCLVLLLLDMDRYASDIYFLKHSFQRIL